MGLKRVGKTDKVRKKGPSPYEKAGRGPNTGGWQSIWTGLRRGSQSAEWNTGYSKWGNNK